MSSKAPKPTGVTQRLVKTKNTRRPKNKPGRKRPKAYRGQGRV